MEDLFKDDMPPSYETAIMNGVKRMNEINRLNREKLDEVVELINTIFKNNGLSEKINNQQIRFEDYSNLSSNPEGLIGIDNIQLDDKKFSEIIFDAIYPQLPKELYVHYTKFNTAESILSTKILRLYNLKKNFSAKEFILFYNEHKFTAYTDDYLGNLMSNLFAFCFTSVSNKHSKLWEHFGDAHKGVKLTFEVCSKISDFRQVDYSEKAKIKLINDLFIEVKNKFGYQLNFSKISQIGAFYIKGDFRGEEEFRLLLNKRTDSYLTDSLVLLKDDEGFDYIELRFISEFAELKLKKVTKGSKCSSELFSKIEEILKNKVKYPDEVEIEK